MEPDRQVEIQLGHMCNNRCVFCVSGQRTGMGMALPLAPDPILQRITEARDQGYAKITLLGGEPTLQPGFMAVVRHCVALGFEEIVIFTNGVKTARASFVDEVLETGGNFTWRISIQGADKQTHERTTKKPGSFDRIVESMKHLHARGQRITVNMCVVQSNYERVDRFPDLLLPFGVRQLHLDMMRPLDAGERTEEELRATIPDYTKMVPALTRMIEGFEAKAPGFDVNVGNFPQCLAPHLAPWIHHDGETTATVAIEGDDRLSDPWNKYEVKARDKVKPESCGRCVFNARCSGVYETYARFHGTDALKPVSPAALAAADPARRLLPLHLRDVVPSLAERAWPAPLGRLVVRETGDDEVTLIFEPPAEEGGEAPLAVALRPPGDGGIAAFDAFGLHLRSLPRDPVAARAGLSALWSALTEHGGAVRHPLGDPLAPVRPSIVARLDRLRRAAPFPGLAWTGLDVSPSGDRARLRLASDDGVSVEFWLDEQGGRAGGGYRLLGDATASETVVAGLRAVVGALRDRRGPRSDEDATLPPG